MIAYKVGTSSSGVKIIYRWRERLQVGRSKQIDDHPQVRGLSTGKKIFRGEQEQLRWEDPPYVG
jgi:hypothetical protein